MIIIKKNEAIAKRKKDAEHGLTVSDIIFPAVNVPPQKMAVSNNLIYIKRFFCTILSLLFMMFNVNLHAMQVTDLENLKKDLTENG